MSTLAIRKGVLTWPGGTGNFTTNLTTGGSWPPGTTVKALLLCMAYNTAEGVADATASFTIGCGTFRGAAVQQWYAHTTSVDAGATAATVNGTDSTAILRGVVTDTVTADFEMDLVSLDSDAFTLNAIDLPATGSIKVQYIALGGNAITDAFAGFSSTDITVAAANTSITITAGFGQPDLLLVGSSTWNANGLGQQDARMMFSAARSGAEQRVAYYGEDDAAADMAVATWMKSRAFVAYSAVTGTADTEGDLAAVVNWPTDGFRIDWVDPPGFVWRWGYLALKGDFTATITSGTSPATAQSLAQNVSLASGTPKGAFVWGNSVPGNSGAIITDDTAFPQLGAFLLGACDADGNEGYVGLHQDDLNASGATSRSHSESKAYASYDPNSTAAATKVQDCDATVSGSNLVLTWDATIATGREYNVLILGETTTIPIDTSGPYPHLREQSSLARIGPF